MFASILKMLQTLVLFIAFSQAVSELCPTGGEIFEKGISSKGKIDVLEAHNARRLEIARGKVPGQPKGINLKRMQYDKALGKKGRVVSETCKMSHVNVFDDRWGQVGQNLYIHRSTEYTKGQDWNRAVNAWFREYAYFDYPNTSRNSTGHYRQVVWAETTHVGCDFIFFFDTTRPLKPYAKLYTCNYGPPGNYKGSAPYKTGKSGCKNLC